MIGRATVSAAVLTAAACAEGGLNDPGGSGATSDPAPAVTTGELSVEAGFGRIAPAGVAITLNATVTGANPTLRWTQISGPTVSLSDATAADPSFTTPDVNTRADLVFELAATDEAGATASDQVLVEVWVPADGDDPTQLADFTDRTGWTCAVDPNTDPNVEIANMGALMSIESNAIPNHATGSFPNGGNPNALAAQSKTYFVTTAPEPTDTPTEMAEFGVTLDGVKLERDTAESYQNAGEWRYEAVTPGFAANGLGEFAWLGTDCNNAHVQPNGEYHYHGLMEGLINRLGERDGAPDDLILGGYAADGFPFYLRYGYADPSDASSDVVVMETSWELRDGTRAGGPGGAYDGTFREDWTYVEGSGDLDECGGRFGPTPEYPDGIYHYYVTDDYPYIPRCVVGAPDSSFRTLGGRP